MKTAGLGSIIRKKIFWAFDAFRQPSVRSQLNDLRFDLSTKSKNTTTRQSRLEYLLIQATNYTEQYYIYRGCSNLKDYPVLQKKQISENQKVFESKAYEGQKLPIMSTSGSTGRPLQFRLSHMKRCRQMAEIIYFSELAGFELGDRHANVRIIRNKGTIRYWMENQVLFDPSVINDGWLERARRELKHPGMVFLTGYARPISVLADYCLRKGDNPDMFALKAIVPTAEGLTTEERNNIELAFGCPVINRYATQEFGVLAQECQACRRLHLNTASYIVELLSLENDTPVPPGRIGRVVVTDLFSHAMPLIRYDIGDLAVLDPDPCPCGNPTPTLRELQGRLVEMILDSRGQLISPFILINSLRQMSGITQFRFVQRTVDDYELMLVATPELILEKHVEDLLRKYLGKNAKIAIRRVDDIPALRSGKRPYVINEYLRESIHGARSTGLPPILAEPASLLGTKTHGFKSVPPDG